MKRKLQAGITYIEIMIGLAMFSLLLTLTTINFPSIVQKTSLDATVVTTISDIKDQQLKAMVGADNTDGNFLSFGVYFEQDKYTLFRGNDYSPTNDTNFVVALGTPIRFQTINLPNSRIIFSVRNGEIQNFVNGQDSITFINTVTNGQKTVHFSKVGVVTGIN